MAKEENKATTIKVSERTRERIEHLKEHKEESADSLINKALNILNICMRSPSLAAKILRDIEKTKKRKELLENPEKIISKNNLRKTQTSQVQENLRANMQRIKTGLS
jgi:hypothetical protein